MTYTSPKLTVDGIIIEDNSLLLIQRKNDPFKGKWALPGGFVEYNETTPDAVQREVLEETGLKTRILSLIGVYSDPNRDPRGHTVSIAYLLKQVGGSIHASDDAAHARFFSLDNLPDLAFDHNKIIKDTLNQRRKNHVL